MIADVLYSSCWVLSGAFLSPHDDPNDVDVSNISNFGSDYMNCTGYNMVVIVSLFECLPLIIRFLQCLRQFHDSKYKTTFPFLFNALKYALSIVVVLYGLTHTSLTPDYLVIIVVTTLYKWWWDIVMDWGLGVNLPSSSNTSSNCCWKSAVTSTATTTATAQQQQLQQENDNSAGGKYDIYDSTNTAASFNRHGDGHGQGSNLTNPLHNYHTSALNSAFKGTPVTGINTFSNNSNSGGGGGGSGGGSGGGGGGGMDAGFNSNGTN